MADGLLEFPFLSSRHMADPRILKECATLP